MQQVFCGHGGGGDKNAQNFMQKLKNHKKLPKVDQFVVTLIKKKPHEWFLTFFEQLKKSLVFKRLSISRRRKRFKRISLSRKKKFILRNEAIAEYEMINMFISSYIG